MPKTKPATEKRGSGKALLVVAAIALLGAMAYVLFPDSAGPETSPAQAAAAQSQPAIPPPETPPAPVVQKVAAQGSLPPLPLPDYPPSRPIEVVQAVYTFAARHPEVLQYVPCFCGCERNGHRGNDDCFVSARDGEWNVTWDPHGMGCGVCIDVARDAMQMYASGAGPADIRAAIDRKYEALSAHKTPTPPVPRKP